MLHDAMTFQNIFQSKAVWLLLIASLTLSLAPSAEAKEIRWSAITMPSYFTGKYGTANSTSIYYLPVIGKAKMDQFTFKVTVPYIQVKSAGTTISGGVVIATGNASQVTTRSGLGDIWLEGRYELAQKWAGASFSPYIKLKLATASATKSLGTGKTDYELGMTTQTRVGSKIFPFAQLGYRVVGKPANTVLRNVFTYRLGSSYLVNREQTVALLYSGKQSSHQNLSNPSEAIASWNYRYEDNLDCQLYASLGLSKGSADYGIGAGVTYRF